MTAPSDTLDGMETATVNAPLLQLTDRCDACGAQAFVRATMETGNDLLFCGHHGTKNEPALVAQGARIYRQEISERKNDTDH